MGELSETYEKLRNAKGDLEQMEHHLAKANSDNERTVKDLKHALATEENRRDQLAKSLDMERNNVAQLHEELAKLRADSREEIEIQKIRLGNAFYFHPSQCSMCLLLCMRTDWSIQNCTALIEPFCRVGELEGKCTKERQKRKELAAELEQQEKSNENLRQALEEEREMARTARQRDRDTVTELQRILGEHYLLFLLSLPLLAVLWIKFINAPFAVELNTSDVDVQQGL